MPHPQRDSSRLPMPLRTLLCVPAALASSRLATVVITLSAAVLAWATWIESEYGAAAAGFGVYRSWWFAALLGLLGLNVLAAAVARFPWKRSQTGFLIVHAGILVLLVGCWISRQRGVDAQLAVFEGGRSSTAFEDSQHFELAVHPRNTTDDAPETVSVPFQPGPFNWEDYASLGWFPWHLARRDQETLLERDGIKLEVLDYYSDSRETPVPELTLAVSRGRAARKRDTEAWRSLVLAVRQLRSPHMPNHPLAIGSREPLSEGQWVVFRMATSKAETDTFRDSRPEGPVGRLGQLVLHAGGKKHRLPLEDLEGKPPVPLGTTGMKVELLRFEPASLRVYLRTYPKEPDARPGALLLHAYRTELDQQDRKNGVFGSYWFDPATKPDGAAGGVPPQAIAAAAEPRVDILQGDDRKLYYRACRGVDVAPVAELPLDGSPVVVFDKTDVPVTIYVERFVPAAEPGIRVEPIAFEKPETLRRMNRVKRQRAKIRLTVDGNAREFWLGDALSESPEMSETAVEGDGRDVAIRLARDRVDLGFQVALSEFQRKLDPGTSRPSHYASRVDLLTPDGQPLCDDVLVELNHPVLVTDPATGRALRLFQSSFSGPYRPGDGRFEQQLGGREKRDELFESIFTVAYDPGRQLKYAGCLMIIAGIAVMYYMKAYFFRRRVAPPSVVNG